MQVSTSAVTFFCLGTSSHRFLITIPHSSYAFPGPPAIPRLTKSLHNYNYNHIWFEELWFIKSGPWKLLVHHLDSLAVHDLPVRALCLHDHSLAHGPPGHAALLLPGEPAHAALDGDLLLPAARAAPQPRGQPRLPAPALSSKGDKSRASHHHTHTQPEHHKMMGNCHLNVQKNFFVRLLILILPRPFRGTCIHLLLNTRLQDSLTFGYLL